MHETKLSAKAIIGGASNLQINNARSRMHEVHYEGKKKTAQVERQREKDARTQHTKKSV
jgi:hypothetical protein